MRNIDSKKITGTPFSSFSRCLAITGGIISMLIANVNAASTRATSEYMAISTPIATSIAIKTVSPDHDYPFFGVDFSMATFGYQEEEFLIAGMASVYDMPAMRASGTFAIELPVIENPRLVSSSHPYRTRMMVIRPTSQSKFNGTVVYEWLNATNMYDVPVHWLQQRDFILRNGYAYVGITVQDATISGPSGLKAWSPSRYGGLDVTDHGKVKDEQLSYDIFSQGAKAVRTMPGVMGSLKVRKVIAVGASQSAGRLSMYLNSIHPNTERMFDGALLSVGGQAMRASLTIPIVKVLSETEVSIPVAAANEGAVLQPDTDVLHTWMVAGAAHADLFGGLTRAVITKRDLGTLVGEGEQECAAPSRSRVNLRHVFNNALVKLEKFIDTGEPIPSAPSFEFIDRMAPSVKRDAEGLIEGGVRLPDVVAPTGVNTGKNSGGRACFLPGSYTPFTDEELASRYKSHADYVAKVTEAAQRSVADGYLLSEDAKYLIDTAAASLFGNGRGGATVLDGGGMYPWKVSAQMLRRHTDAYPIPDRPKLLALLDEASNLIAHRSSRHGIELLENYIMLIRSNRANGIISTDVEDYLCTEASKVIEDISGPTRH